MICWPCPIASYLEFACNIPVGNFLMFQFHFLYLVLLFVDIKVEFNLIILALLGSVERVLDIKWTMRNIC